MSRSASRAGAGAERVARRTVRSMSPDQRRSTDREGAHTHPGFARAYDLLTSAAERLPFAAWRTRALAPASGRLLVVGLGPGHDLAHLPSAVTEVVGVEPDPAMRARARRRTAGAGVPVRVVSAVGERLPLPDASCDSALVGLVLCSVDDPVAVLREVHRVLRPGAALLVFEHVRAPDGSWQARVQDRLDRPWGRAAGGCHLNRRTREALVGAGFDDGGVRDVTIRAGLPWMTAHLLGTARRPG